MAGKPGRSGGANGGPQYNPANVKPLGGNGQSGKMSLNYTGMPYGQNQATNQQRIRGNEAVAAANPQPLFNAGSARMGEEASLAALTPITAETTLPNQPITEGVPVGDGANSIPGLPMGQTEDPDIDMIRNYYPMLEFWASQPSTSQATKDYVQYLRTII